MTHKLTTRPSLSRNDFEVGLRKALGTLNDVRGKLDSIPNRLDAREDAIKSNPDTTEEHKRIQLRKLREELRLEQQTLLARHSSTLQEVDEIEKVAEFAANSIHGSAEPSDRLAKALATGPAGGSYQQVVAEGGGEHADG